jgi:Flp pilus assembly protein TadD
MNLAFKLAASSLVLGTVMLANPASGRKIESVSPITKTDEQAAKLAAQAEDALKERDATKALIFAEGAVEYSPADAGHRALLGQAYMLAGRFASAATTFRDALALDPAHGRAALGLALAETALGRLDSARDALAQAKGNVADADYGLALALAGDVAGGVTVLEFAARSEGATSKTRQNLALAYAMAGRWKESQIVAAQDVPADQLLERMMKWAQFARPQVASDQVASLLGVHPAVDPGQPQRLALLPAAPEPVALAATVEQPVVEAPVAAPPLVVASAEPTAVMATAPEASIPVIKPVAPVIAPKTYAVAPAFATKPEPMIRKVSLPASKPKAVRQVVAVRPKPARVVKPGNFVVQLGAFSSARGVEAAWTKVNARSRYLGSYTPSSTTFRSANRVTMYRLSVGGFATRAEAWKLCNEVKAKGGACFVRGTAGDAPMQWASRDKGTRIASR